MISAYFERFSARLFLFVIRPTPISPLLSFAYKCTIHKPHSGYETLELQGLSLLAPSAPPGRPCSVRSIHPSVAFVKSIFTQCGSFPARLPPIFRLRWLLPLQKMRRSPTVHSLLSPFPSLSNRHNKNATDPNGIIRSPGRAPSTDRVSAMPRAQKRSEEG